MNPDYASLRSYVNTQRQTGIADTTIYQSLVASGWPEAVVQQFLSSTPQPFDSIASQHASSSPQSAYATTSADGTGFFGGRLGRLGFLMALVYVLIYFILAIVLAIAGHGSRIINIVVLLMGMIGVLAVLPITVSIHIRRWHDLGQSGWLTLLGLLPFIGFIITILLLVLPGTSGPNKYGYTHPESLSPKFIFGISK